LEWESKGQDWLIPLEMTNCSDPDYPISAAMAYYYGFFYAASSKRGLKLNPGGEYEIYFTGKNEVEIKPFRNFLRLVFGIQKYAVSDKNRWVFKLDEPIFLDWLRYMGAIRENDEAGPVFPPNFLDLDRTLQQHFIAGFMATQGFQGILPSSYKGMGSLRREPLEQMQIALMSMGIYTQISVLMTVGGFELNIVGAKSLDNFYQLYKKSRWKPTHFFEHASKPMKKDSVMTPYSVRVNKTIVNPVSWRFFEKFKNKDHQYPLIRRRVETIFDDGIEETYDLELAEENLFWCNGFYVHNSGRRGALMLTMDVRHPDIVKFINCKMDKSRVTNANISVKFTDEFMRAVVNDSNFTLQWPVDAQKPKISQVVKARDIWNQFLAANQKSSEPGALFWDRMASYTPNASYADFKPVCVNPCAEVGMGPFSNCRLVSMNLLPFVKNPFTPEAFFDKAEFEKAVEVAAQFIDNIVDIDLEKMRNIQDLSDDIDVKELWAKFIEKTERGREVGLGTLAVADVLSSLGLRYGSDEAIQLVDEIYYLLAKTAYRTSHELGIARGPFPAYDPRVEIDEFTKFNHFEEYLRRRNISLLTCAPTGSISLITQTSSGIEPVFKNTYTRRKKVSNEEEGNFTGTDGQRYEEFTVVHRNVQKYMDMNPGKELPFYFVDAHAVLPEEKVKMQEAAQRHICHSISNTVNLPSTASLEHLDYLYIDSWKRGLKGVTVYVDGSRDGILVTNKAEAEPAKVMKRPERLPCDIHLTTVKGQKWVVFVGLLDGRPYEAFCGLQEYVELSPKIKSGTIVKRKTKKSERGIYDLVAFEGEPNEFVIHDIVNAFKNDEHMVLGRLVSLALRFVGKPSHIAEQLFKDNSSDFMTYNKVLARILKKYIKDGEKPEPGSFCAECGGELTYQEGCLICMTCGYSKCS
jgi:ribonucleoside-diphosphate reductase alpha chain